MIFGVRYSVFGNTFYLCSFCRIRSTSKRTASMRVASSQHFSASCRDAFSSFLRFAVRFFFFGVVRQRLALAWASRVSVDSFVLFCCTWLLFFPPHSLLYLRLFRSCCSAPGVTQIPGSHINSRRPSSPLPHYGPRLCTLITTRVQQIPSFVHPRRTMVAHRYNRAPWTVGVT